jgi:starch phosphorylase
LQEFQAIKRGNKVQLAAYIGERTGITVAPDSLFDIQVKRVHEYKRQLLAILRVAAEYLRMKEDRTYRPHPRSYLFAGKAAPGYVAAKTIIKLANSVADVVNHDVDVQGRITVAFLRNYRVSLAERIFPAAEVSEQISTAGKEASGTGNMKFMLNGALTIGTLDGANVEIREEVGADNFFLFGLDAAAVERVKREGYRPAACVEGNEELRAVLDLVREGRFSRGDTEVFKPVIENLVHSDPFLVLADFADYAACQERVSAAWADAERWTRMSVLNTARSGKFSSDRAIAEYCHDIWGVQPVRVDLD